MISGLVVCFEHQHFLREPHMTFSCSTCMHCIHIFQKKGKKKFIHRIYSAFHYILNNRSCLRFIRQTKQIEKHQLFFSLFFSFLKHNTVAMAWCLQGLTWWMETLPPTWTWNFFSFHFNFYHIRCWLILWEMGEPGEDKVTLRPV